MDSGALLDKTEPRKQEKLEEMALIPRYNVFVRNYNQPNCIVDGVLLQELPTSGIHDRYFLLLKNWKGKLLFGIFLVIPGIDCFLFLLSLFTLLTFCKCLSIHDQNQKSVVDPFKNMVYDHDLCFKLNKDYNSFTIEFKELEGFSLNYNRDMRKELSLREERGKANFFIYNGNFWASYHHLPKWKTFHLVLFGLSGVLCLGINLFFFLWLL